MDSSDHDANSQRRRDPDALPGGNAEGNLAANLAAIDARLDQLDRTTAAFEQRLQVIEGQLRIAAPSPAVSPPNLPRGAQTWPAPRVPAVVAAPPESMPVRSESGTLLAAAHALLDGKPFSRPRPAPLSATPAASRSPSGMTSAPLPRVPKRPTLALDDLERAVTGRGLAWIGGLALLLGALFFLSLAISRGWIGPEARVVIGLVAGTVITVLGDRLMRDDDRVLGPVLVAVGIGIWNLALVAGTRLYDFVPLWAALLGAAAGALVATAIAIRADIQIVALYGLVTALAAPILFAVPAERIPIAYLVIILVGSTAISIARGWSWLPPVAFALTEWQFYRWWWAAQASEWLTLLAITSISLLHLVAATGVDLRARSRDSQLVALVLLLLNAVAFSVVGFGVLEDAQIPLGAYLLGGVVAHAATGRFVLRRNGEATVFARVAFAIAVTLLTIAPAVVFDGALVAVAWSVEAIALLWLAQRYRSTGGYLTAAIVFGLAVWHLFIIEYETARLGAVAQLDQAIPFVNDAGFTLLILLTILVAAGAIVREQWVRVPLATIGFGLLIAALPYELSGLVLLAGWALLAVLALGSERFLAVSSDAIPLDRDRSQVIANGLKLAAAVAAGLAVHRAVAYEMPVLTEVPLEAGVPYAGQPIAAAAIIIVAAIAAMAVTISEEVREIAGSVGLLIAAHLAAFELDPAPAVAAWAALAVGAWALSRHARSTIPIYFVTAALLLISGVAVTITKIAPPTRLLLTVSAEIDHAFLWSDATLALGALAVAFFVIGWSLRGTSAGGWLRLGSGVLTLYLLSIGIVDEFQRRVDGPASVEELRRQSQVALSVVWAVLGGITVAAGLVRAVAPLRWFGLGLLALATAKVFLYDLASLDAVYRVLSFIVLGVLLLLSAYAYRRLGATADRGSAVPDRAGRPSAPGAPG